MSQVAGEPIIRVRNLHRVYHLGGEDIHAVNDVTMNIAPGQMTAIVGRSGSGKTTLLNLIAGLDDPTEGTVWLDGQRLDEMDGQARLAMRRDRIGFVFQTFNLLPRLDALENVVLPLLYRGRVQDAQKRAMAALVRTGLANRADHRPTELSGGQRKLVGLELEGRRIARQDNAVLDQAGQAVGTITSGTMSSQATSRTEAST